MLFETGAIWMGSHLWRVLLGDCTIKAGALWEGFGLGKLLLNDGAV